MTSYSIFLFLIWYLLCLQGPKGPPGHKGEFGLPGRPVGVGVSHIAYEGGHAGQAGLRAVGLLRPLPWVSGSPRTEWPQRRQRRSRGHDAGECHTRDPAPCCPRDAAQGQCPEEGRTSARSSEQGSWTECSGTLFFFLCCHFQRSSSPALSSGLLSGGPCHQIHLSGA